MNREADRLPTPDSRLLVDCHAHVVPEAALARFPDGSSPRYVTAERTVLARMLEAQAAAGVTHALISDSFYLESAAEELPSWSGTDRARLFNDALAEMISRHPDRLYGLGCLDPFDGGAARELERMGSELGLVGALVNPSDGRRYLDDPAAEPLLAAAEQLGFPLFIHPSRDLLTDEAWNDFALGVSVSRPTQTTICAARLIYTGALDRHPGLKLLLAHGGGMLPYVAGRLDATWSAYRRAGRWQGVDVLERPPGDYLRCFYCDTNTWSSTADRLLVDRVGFDRLVFGSDQPPIWFPLEQSIAALDCLELPDEETAAVHWGNAARLFGLPLGN